MIQDGLLSIADSPEMAAPAVGHFTCAIPLSGVVVTTQPKTLRQEAPFAFRLDVRPPSPPNPGFPSQDSSGSYQRNLFCT